MSIKPQNRIASLNAAIRKLHEELKSLVLTCSPEFPGEATGGLEFLAIVAEVQTTLAAFEREVLVCLFKPKGQDALNTSSGRASFINLWEKRGKISHSEGRSESEIDAAIRELLAGFVEQTRLLGEEEMRRTVKNEHILEMAYYLSTLQESLGWYLGRYLGRMTGSLPE